MKMDKLKLDVYRSSNGKILVDVWGKGGFFGSSNNSETLSFDSIKGFADWLDKRIGGM
jgi:hypothetical protein